jgi:hypothetical protein
MSSFFMSGWLRVENGISSLLRDGVSPTSLSSIPHVWNAQYFFHRENVVCFPFLAIPANFKVNKISIQQSLEYLAHAQTVSSPH